MKKSPQEIKRIRLGVDIGGTFTDVVLENGSKIFSSKILTTPNFPEIAILDGITEVTKKAGVQPNSITQIIHGTTLATNAIIERKGARTAFITTTGFRDVIEMRTESRFEQYDLNLAMPLPLISREHRYVVNERLSATGEILIPIDKNQILDLVANLSNQGYQSIAVGLIHSYANDHHEKYIKNIETKETLINIRKEYLNSLANINTQGERYICDKMPHNFLLIDLIRFILPEAKIIYCKRKPADNCFSLLTQRFVEGRHLYCYNQKTLAEYYQFHENLMNVWLEKFKKDIFILDNEDLVNNQKNITIELLKFCGLDWEDSCMEFYKTKRQVRTASLEQVRQPINKKSIGAWENYRPHLAEMIGVLEKNVT